MLNEYTCSLANILTITGPADINERIAHNWGYEMELSPCKKYVVNNAEHERFLKRHQVEVEWFDDHAQLIQDGRIYLVEVKHEPDGILIDYSTLEHI